MPIITGFNHRFTPSWQMSLVALLGIVFFIWLGCWQLNRAQVKQALLQQYEQQATYPPQPWDATYPLPVPYQRVIMTGRLLPTVFYLDNQHHDHQFGYDVISPLLLPSGHIVLVDRGWVAGDVTRRELPRVDVPTEPVTLIGYAYQPSTYGWGLGPMIERKNPEQVIVERIDVIPGLLTESVYPFIVRLEQTSCCGFIRQWPLVSVLPIRHYGYAVQWFAMALTVGVLFVVLNVRKSLKT